MQGRMKENPLLLLFALRNSQMRHTQTVCFSGIGSALASRVALQILRLKEKWDAGQPELPFFFSSACLRESLMWEACFKPSQIATEARNWLTQSV